MPFRAYLLHVQAAEAAAALIDRGIVAGVASPGLAPGELMPGFSVRPGSRGAFWVCLSDAADAAEAAAVLDAHARALARGEGVGLGDDWPSDGVLLGLGLACPACRHSLSGVAPAGACPECGSAYDKRAMVERLLGE